MKLEGFEPPTFGSGIRRAANCAIASLCDVMLNPGFEPGLPQPQ